MTGFSISATNHTSFTVSDLDRSLAYFCDVLGFELLNRSPRDPAFIELVVAIPGADIEVAYVQAPGHRLELIQYRGPDGRRRVESRPCDAGFAHVAFDVDDIDAVICIGCVIRGETDHYDHVANAASTGISKANEDFGKPVIFGVLTTENTEQAAARIGHTIDYVDAAVEMANTMRQIHELT